MTIEQITEEVNNTIYQHLNVFLAQYCPDYIESEDFLSSERLGDYLYFHNYTLFLIEEVLKNETSAFVRNSFDFINECCKSNNLEILNIMKVSVLETLYSTKVIREQIKVNLAEESLALYLACSKNYY